MWMGVKRFFEKLQENEILLSIRKGMILAIPAVMAGSISLLLLGLPLPFFQTALRTFLNGTIAHGLLLIHHATLDMISLILLFTISFSYGREKNHKFRFLFPIVTLCSYLISVTDRNGEFTPDVFQSGWLFNAIFVSALSCKLFEFFSGFRRKKQVSYTDGADSFFNTVVEGVIPCILVIAFFAAWNLVLMAFFQQPNFQLLFSDFFSQIFEKLGRNLFSSLLFIFFMHFLWFFGIHGANVLDNVAKGLFESGLQKNLELIEVGQLPTEIFSKTFFDTFVLMGGCGTILCMVIAVFLFDKRKNIRELSRIAGIPALFNMNEMMVFGLPIVFNFVYLIPFLCTPLILTLISYTVMKLHLVPYVTHTVTWTVPFFISGYVATGSIAGSILQLVNIAIGVLIYFPFIRLSQRNDKKTLENNILSLTELVKEGEANGKRPELVNRGDKLAFTAKYLVGEIQYGMKTKELELFYQPQFRYDGSLFGLEALLRWKHPLSGYLYPPLVIALAEEAGIGKELGFLIIEKTCETCEKFQKKYQFQTTFSVNVTSDQLDDELFGAKIEKYLEQYHIQPKSLGIELTEQTALTSSQVMLERLQTIRSLGIDVIMDDFGMGHSSLMYLRNGHFDLIKLDGTLVREILDNSRCRDIISSIVHLSDSLGFEILAEYVETEEQRKVLKELGCENYQGYLYSQALSEKDLIFFLQEKEMI